MNDPIFDALHAEIDAASNRMDAAGVPKLLRLRCDWCDATGRDLTCRTEARCVACNGRGYIVTDAVTP